MIYCASELSSETYTTLVTLLVLLHTTCVGESLFQSGRGKRLTRKATEENIKIRNTRCFNLSYIA